MSIVGADSLRKKWNKITKRNKKPQRVTQESLNKMIKGNQITHHIAQWTTTGTPSTAPTTGASVISPFYGPSSIGVSNFSRRPFVLQVYEFFITNSSLGVADFLSKTKVSLVMSPEEKDSRLIFWRDDKEVVCEDNTDGIFCKRNLGYGKSEEHSFVVNDYDTSTIHVAGTVIVGTIIDWVDEVMAEKVIPQSHIVERLKKLCNP